MINARAIIRKLQNGIKQEFGIRLIINTAQFYGATDTPITRYRVLRVINSHKNVELYQDSSSIRVVLFLRDYLFTLKQLSLPMDNEEWNNIRELRAQSVFDDLRAERGYVND